MNRNNNHYKYNKYRKQYKRFIYESFDYSINENTITASFYFNLDNKHSFRPTIQFPFNTPIVHENIMNNHLKNIVFHIGMVELISYWKAACPPEIVIKPYALNFDQIKFWKKIYFNGLGEFFYLNSISTSIDEFVKISTSSDNVLEKCSLKTENYHIIPIGGGKDSTVSMELLSGTKNTNLLLILNPRKACLETAHVGGYEDDKILKVYRTIDPLLIKLNDEGYLNGHTPFSALLAFISLLAASVVGYKNIVLSNESSSNESTVENSSVNHQYSKSIEFESDFREYYMKYITSDINYFSFLRPINETQIAKLFALNEAYFNVFKSCNVGSKNDIWCGKCAKCLFIFIILSPFIPSETMIRIFGSNLFEKKELICEFEQLIGLSETKPFECVGTIEEVNISLCEIINKHTGNKLPFLLNFYKTTINYKTFQNKPISLLLKDYNDKHFLSTFFETILKNKLND